MPERVHGPLRALLAAWLLFGTGTWAFAVAVVVYAFDVGGAGWVAAITAARLLPAMAAAPWTGRLLDRVDRARVAAVGAALVAAAQLGTAFLMGADAPLITIAALAAVAGAAATAPRPALEALMPALADSPQELTRATAAWSALDNGGFLLGSGLGGIAIAAVGPAPVVAGGAAVAAWAALFATRLPATTAIAADEPEEERGALEETLSGLRALVASSGLRAPFALLAGLVLLDGTTEVQLVVLALDDLDLGEGGPGLLYFFWGLGGIAGSLVLLAALRRRGYGLALALGALSFGGAVAITGSAGVVVALFALAVAGVGFAMVETAAMAVVPRLADDAVVGRVYALYEVLYSGAIGIGALIAPPLIDWFGTRGSLAFVGAAYVLLGLALWRPLAGLDRGQEEASRVRELLRGVPFLAPLPLPRLERLVRAARPLAFPAGESVVELGDPGEDFFVIEEGSVEVVEYGRRQGVGEAFGEIALLQECSRTATVRAATDLRLRALSRPAFLAAVGAHDDSRRLAAATAAEHLARPRVDR